MNVLLGYIQMGNDAQTPFFLLNSESFIFYIALVGIVSYFGYDGICYTLSSEKT